MNSSWDELIPEIRRVVRRVARDEGVVDDIVQECCVRIIQKEELWDASKGTFRAWVATVSRNVTFRCLGSRRRELPLTEEPPESRSEDVSPDRIRWVIRQFSRLTEAQRTVLILRYFHGLTTVQVAERLGIRQQSVSDRHQQAIFKLRRRSRIQGVLSLLTAGLCSREFMIMNGKQKLVAATLAFLALGSVGTFVVQSAHHRSRERVLERKLARADARSLRLAAQVAELTEKSGSEVKGPRETTVEPVPGTEEVESSSAKKNVRSVPSGKAIPRQDLFSAWQLPDPHMKRNEVLDYYGALMQRDDPTVDLYLQHCLSLIDVPAYVTTIDGSIVKQFEKGDDAVKAAYVAAVQKNLFRARTDVDLFSQFTGLARRLPNAYALQVLNGMESHAPTPELRQHLRDVIDQLKSS